MIPLGENICAESCQSGLLITTKDALNLRLGPGIPERAAVFPPVQDHDKHSFPQDCKVVARVVLGDLHHEYRRLAHCYFALPQGM